ncbi:hypothetical protein ACFLUU_10675 [Chloroflexota bacterium]
MASDMYVRIEQKDGQSQARMAEALEKRLKEAGIKINGSMTVDVISSSWTGQVRSHANGMDRFFDFVKVERRFSDVI